MVYSIYSPTTHRIHCISDWRDVSKAKLCRHVRLDSRERIRRYTYSSDGRAEVRSDKEKIVLKYSQQTKVAGLRTTSSAGPQPGSICRLDVTGQLKCH